MSTNNHFSKISLSKQELAHVYQSLFLALQSKIDKMLPQTDSHDELMISAKQKMNRRLESTFEFAKYAFVVDGRDLAVQDDGSVSELLSMEQEDQVEPFDSQLNQELRDLIETVEKETTEVTRLRRELPLKARDAYELLVNSTDTQVTGVVAEIEESGRSDNGRFDNDAQSGMIVDSDGSGAEDLAQSLANLLDNERVVAHNSDIIKQTYSASVEDLHALKQEIPDLHTRFKSMNSTAQVMLQSLERSVNEPKYYE